MGFVFDDDWGAESGDVTACNVGDYGYDYVPAVDVDSLSGRTLRTIRTL